MLGGYPDVAFADGDGGELDVAVAPGGSLTAEDPGPGEVAVPVGGRAVSTLSWGAGARSDRGARVLHAAPPPGHPGRPRRWSWTSPTAGRSP